MLRITEELAKKRFYRAYEMTQGRKYNKEKSHELWIIRRSELERECGTCEIRDTCTDPCPDALLFIEQDHVNPSLDQPLPSEVEDQDPDQEPEMEPDLSLDKIID